MRISSFLAPLLLAAGPLDASALDIFACEPEWASLAEELGGDRVRAFSAVTGRQDVHAIEARPSLIARFRSAQLVVCTGADLEAGWLPVLLRQGANPAVRPGGRGFLEAALHVPMLDVPETLDRSQGELHPLGNPHIQLDPRNIGRVAAEMTRRLAELDPDGAEEYLSRGRDFQARWSAAIDSWEEKSASLEGMAIISHHRSWAYLVAWLGLEDAANLEPKPGIEPSTSHLATLLSTAESRGVKLIVRSSYENPRASEWLSRQTGIPAVVLPHTVGSVDGVNDLFELFAEIIARLDEAGG